MRSLHHLSLLLSALAHQALAQSQYPNTGLPSCGQNCFDSEVQQGCGKTDAAINCVCTTPAPVENIQFCLKSSTCSQSDQQKIMDYISETCPGAGTGYTSTSITVSPPPETTSLSPSPYPAPPYTTRSSTNSSSTSTTTTVTTPSSSHLPTMGPPTYHSTITQNQTSTQSPTSSSTQTSTTSTSDSINTSDSTSTSDSTTTSTSPSTSTTSTSIPPVIVTATSTSSVQPMTTMTTAAPAPSAQTSSTPQVQSGSDAQSLKVGGGLMLAAVLTCLIMF